MGKILTSEEDILGERGRVIYRNELDGFIDTHLPITARGDINEIVKRCFSLGADMVQIYLNKTNGRLYCSCFKPIHFNKTSKTTASYSIIKIGRIVVLPLYSSKTGRDIPEDIMNGVVNIARGFWDGDYAFAVLNEDGSSE